MLFCGIDIGTTNTKAVILDSDGRLLNCATIPVAYPDESWQLPAEVWFEHFSRVMAQFAGQGLLGEDKVFASIATQGGSFTVLDRSFRAISPGISWMALASDTTVRALESAIDPQQFYETTGWQINPWMMVCKLKEQLARARAGGEVHQVVTVPDFIHARLAGRFITDITNAEITGLYDFQRKQWWPQMLEWLRLDGRCLPHVVDRPEVILENAVVEGGKLSLVTSCHDQYAAMIGSGVHEGTLMLATGSAWVINGKSTRPVFDFERFAVHPGRDLDPERFGFIATFGPVGKGFELLLQKLDIGYNDLAKRDGEFQKAGLPRHAVNPDAVNSTTKAEAIRRYMEAAGARVRFTLETMGVDIPSKLIMTGGAVTGGRWPAIIANICRIPVEAIFFDELTAYGAACLARMAVLGESGQTGWPTAARTVVHEPNPKENYETWYRDVQRPVLEMEKSI